MKKILLHSFTILIILVMGACSSDATFTSVLSEKTSQTLSVNDLVQPCNYSFNELNEGVDKLKNKIIPSVFCNQIIWNKEFFVAENKNKIFIGLKYCLQRQNKGKG